MLITAITKWSLTALLTYTGVSLACLTLVLMFDGPPVVRVLLAIAFLCNAVIGLVEMYRRLRTRPPADE